MKYIFLHIPKNGGMTFRKVIDDQYGSRQIYNISKPGYDEALKDFNKKNIFYRNRVKIIRGMHFAYGCHRTLKRPDKAKYFAMLRNPIDRAYSFYNYVKRHPEHELYKEIHLDNLTFTDFISNKELNMEVCDSQTKFIAGIGQNETCNDEIYDNAIRHIEETFFLVGIMERYDETLFILKRLLNWKKPVRYQLRNANPNKNNNRSEKDLSILESLNKYDLKLYKRYLEHFEERLHEYNENKLDLFLADLRME